KFVRTRIILARRTFASASPMEEPATNPEDDGRAAPARASGSGPDREAAPSEVLPVLPRDRYDLRILSSLRRIVRSIDTHSRRLAADHGMTVPQLLCMIKVDELGALTLKELASEVHLSPSTLVGIVDRLEKSGIFARERSVMDRRKLRITLTDKGRALLAQSPSPLQADLVQAIERLPELERATIALALERIVECIGEELPRAKAPPSSFVAPILDASTDLAAPGDVSPKLRK